MNFARLRVLWILVAVGVTWPQQVSGQVPAAPTPEVTLQPGDLIRVVIWREEDLSGEFPVNENGIVTFPLLGDRDVRGVSIPALREALVEEYRAELRNPSIFLTPLRRISVLGEVRMPNVYSADPTVTLGTAIALAGGATPSGDLRNIEIRRGGERMRFRGDTTEPLASVEIQSGDEIVVMPISWMARNSTVLFSSGVSFALFTLSMLLR